ncbi:MAG: hypothetical protein KKA84_11420 [Bacteroidetes bacterium]|nr:hypothetical protein [Bacteroidota bacterium]
MRKQLAVQYKGNSQIEVGGPLAGIEFHKGLPLPQRVSYFSPVANSIDNSADYWFRDTTQVIDIKLKVNNGQYKTIASQIWKYELTPYRVEFCNEGPDLQIKISYEFCKTISAFVIKYSITNTTASENEYSLQTLLSSGLRTCHTYDSVSPSRSTYSTDGSTAICYYDDFRTQFPAVFVTNTGEMPCYDSSSAQNSSSSDYKFRYVKTLAQRESLNIVQVIGSNNRDGVDNTITYLKENYQKEIDDLEKYVLNKTFSESEFITNEKSIDHTYKWAKAVIISNTHYIDQDTVLMPCPAEYNFFFTHDMLVTDLSRVNYDIKSVENDLLFIQKHSNKENVIPHAYYWKDSSYFTEYSELDNWNHLWFVILCGKYLKHSNNIPLLKNLYPLIQRSIEITLGNKKEDDLMWASRPDGWDIGNSYGPRSFMTILAIKALREYVYVAARIEKNENRLLEYESLSNRMQIQLNAKLWNDDKKYLINYYQNDSLDTHYYIGSLLAAHFNLIGKERKLQIIESARQKLLDAKLGIYNVYPMDFHLLKDFLKFQGNEVGQPFLYANGGIWSHANAWYLLNLTASNKNDEAYEFVKKIMTLEGIINSPNGQPAMYEYRCSNYSDSSVYGKVDKPQFSWAASWYIYSLYHLFGIKDNDWNINLDPWLKKDQLKCIFNIVINNSPVEVTLEGHGEYASSIKYDDVEEYSLVIGMNVNNTKSIRITMGEMNAPYITETNSMLESCNYDKEKNIFKIELKSFPGHEGFLEIASGIEPVEIYQSDKNIIEGSTIKKQGNVYEIKIPYKQNNESEIIKLHF